MFALFFSLYLAMFRGTWLNCNLTNIKNGMESITNKIFEFLSSLFNNVASPVSDLGSYLFGTSTIQGVSIENYLIVVAFVLALITSIGIVVMAVKGVKKAFGIFFMGIRR